MDNKEKDYLDTEDLEVNENTEISEDEKVCTDVDTDVSDANESADEIDDIETEQGQKDNEWKFDATAPTLDENLSLDDKFSVEIDNDDKSEDDESSTHEDETVDNKKHVDPKTVRIITTAVLSVLLIIAIAFFGYKFFTTPNTEEKMNPGNVAVTIGDTKVSIGMYNYCYNGTVNRILKSHGNELKPDVPFSKQNILDADGNLVNLEEYFKTETMSYLQSMMACYEEGIKSGIELTAQQQADIDQSVAKIKENAIKADKSINEYTQSTFGDYCGLATYKKYVEQQMIANEYKNRLFATANASNEECEQFFNDNIDKFEQASVGFLLIPFNPEEEGSKDSVIADAQEYCKSITDIDKLKELVPTIYKDIIDKNIEMGHFKTSAEAIENLEKMVVADINMQSTEFSNEVKDWVFSDDTQVNACNYFVDDYFQCVFIVLKTSEPSVNEGYNEKVYNVRHILVKPKHTQDDADPNSDFTEEDWAAAEKEAQNIYDEFKQGDKSELSFALLAEEYSEDVESTSNGRSNLYGGIIDNCSLGSTVKDFENWAIDENRVYGDSGIVKTEFGYHVMFFKSFEPLYISISRSEIAYESAEENIESHKVVEHKNAMKKTKVAKIGDYQ